MKKVFLFILLTFVFELGLLFQFYTYPIHTKQDTVAINEALQTIEKHWNQWSSFQNPTTLDFVVLDLAGTQRYRTKEGLSETIHEAIQHNDLILDIVMEEKTVGKMILYNKEMEQLEQKKRSLAKFLVLLVTMQCLFFIGYLYTIFQGILHPFQQLKKFAKDVAAGHLDAPLTMDRKNIFGAFSEAFDLMRTELKQARLNEAKANAQKKELVAKLSHDIKTPIASIKAVSEVGVAQTKDEKAKGRYLQIIQKADQINTLVTNLFNATLEELQQISFHMEDIDARELKTLLENSDYHHKATIAPIPDCLVNADKLRLQQVFDNLFANSYKYAGTNIQVDIRMTDTHLLIMIEDFGQGVTEEELPHLKEKFKRGSNCEHIEGAGLGLFISDYFMNEMHGSLMIENGEHGLRTTVMLAFSGHDLRNI